MISAFIFGGLGNQLFQFAAAYAESLRKGDKLVIPEPFQGETHDAESRCIMRRIIETSGCSGELDLGCIMMPQAYYQDSKYFDGYEGCLIDALSPIHPRCRFTEEIALHVRMGDYFDKQHVHPVIGEDYIRAAVSWQLEQGASRVVHLFSDSPDLALPYVQRALSGFDVVVLLAPQASSIEHLRLLAGYDHLICSNSTYAWWAAWLHRAISQQSFVAMPSRWFGASGPQEWGQIYRGVSTGVVKVVCI